MVFVGLIRPTLLLFLCLPLVYSVSDSEALLQFKKSLKSNNPKVFDSWDPALHPPCVKGTNKWHYVMCDKSSGDVTGLNLGSLGLAGDIDVAALEGIKGLRNIGFNNNTFEGPLPEFNRLGYLKALFLAENGFSGEIADDYFLKMRSLKKLYMESNKFTGPIPTSLAKLTNLKELSIHNNQFSGTIPPFPKGFQKFNLSNNMLEGPIPTTLAAMNASFFTGNQGLCGKPLDKECPAGAIPPPPEDVPAPPEQQQNAHSTKGSALPAILVLVLVVVILMIATVVVVKRRREFDMLERESFAEPPEMHVPPPVKEMETPSVSSRGTPSSRKGSQHGKGAGAGDLVVVNDEKGVFGLPDLMKAAAEVLGNGSLGSAYKAVMTNGVAVAVKRMRDMNKVAKDGFDMELRRLGALHHRNILTPLAYHFRKEEKLVVYEYVPRGSLLFLLHGDRGSCQGELDWPTRLKIIHGIARGMAFLHTELASYDLPHGNLKSSNIFLSSDYEPLLSDYGFWAVVNPAQATQSMFAFKAPEATEYELASPKCDVYCFGIVILEILTGKFPSQYLHNGTGGTDVVQWVLSALLEGKETELFDPEIASATESYNEMEQLLYIGAALVETNPEKRPTMKEAVKKIEEIQVGQGRAPTLKEEYAKLSSSPMQ